MATKRHVRADNTYIISTDSTDNPKLGAKILKDGRSSLFLDFYFGYTMVRNNNSGKVVARKERKREYLRLYLEKHPSTSAKREKYKETLMLAKRVRFEREQEMLENKRGYRLKSEQDTDFLRFFQTYIDHYTKKDIRIVRMALQRFKDFLVALPRYGQFAKCIRMEQLDKDMVAAFAEYLQGRSIGEGAKAVFQRFKKVVRHAVEQGAMTKNPCEGITVKADDQLLRKEVLSTDEVLRLANTHYVGENKEVRKAFLLCLYCGLRYCDVRDLTFANIDYANRLLRFEQNKTRGHSAHSGVVIPLSEGLLHLMGKPAGGQSRESRLFVLPSYVTCLNVLRRWMKAAGIDKHITWHCARHSFAVNILNNGANIKTVASLLGHSGLRHTEKYTRAVDHLKAQAINSLPTLEKVEG